DVLSAFRADRHGIFPSFADPFTFPSKAPNSRTRKPRIGTGTLQYRSRQTEHIWWPTNSTIECLVQFCVVDRRQKKFPDIRDFRVGIRGSHLKVPAKMPAACCPFLVALESS